VDLWVRTSELGPDHVIAPDDNCQPGDPIIDIGSLVYGVTHYTMSTSLPSIAPVCKIIHNVVGGVNQSPRGPRPLYFLVGNSKKGDNKF
jgi:hypothetical protein